MVTTPLGNALRQVAEQATPVDLVEQVRRGARRRRNRRAAIAGSMLAVIAAAAIPWAITRSGPVAASGPATCGAPVTAPLPSWARGGFQPPDTPVLHEVSTDGLMVAVLFGDPLTAPPAADHHNKVLWVSQPTAAEGNPSAPHFDDLQIDAHLAGSKLTVQRQVTSGPGPSYVDLPQPGCWQLTLHWFGHHDTMDLYYARQPSTEPTS